MLDRASCERRVYRLAVMLTGNPNAATGVISQVVGSQPDLAQLDSAHMDRLTVLRSREIKPAALVHDAIPQPSANAVANLTAQQREAWVFGRVYRTPLREMARAMDCSSTAAERHLLQADVAIRTAIGIEPSIAATQFLKASLAIDVPEFHRRRLLIKRRMKLATRAIVLILITAALVALVAWWTRPLERSDRERPATQSAASQPSGQN